MKQTKYQGETDRKNQRNPKDGSTKEMSQINFSNENCSDFGIAHAKTINNRNMNKEV